MEGLVSETPTSGTQWSLCSEDPQTIMNKEMGMQSLSTVTPHGHNTEEAGKIAHLSNNGKGRTLWRSKKVCHILNIQYVIIE